MKASRKDAARSKRKGEGSRPSSSKRKEGARAGTAPSPASSVPPAPYMFAQAPAPSSSQTAPTPHEDCNSFASFVPDTTTARCCTSLPKVCEVTDSSLQDPALASVYDGLPNLL